MSVHTTTRHGQTAQIYNDGWNAGRWGEKDKAEMYFQNWGKKAAETYRHGYMDGSNASVSPANK